MRALTHRAAALAAVAVFFAIAIAARTQADRGGSGGRGDGPVVFVTSQGLYYDSIVTADPLPPHGGFQQLFPPDETDSRLRTELGPGDPGYRGGRWWVDANGNGQMDEGDHFFSCPLLGPGRASAVAGAGKPVGSGVEDRAWGSIKQLSR